MNNLDNTPVRQKTSFLQQLRPKNKLHFKTVFLHLGLFVITFASVTYAGASWVGQNAASSSLWALMGDGMVFAVLLLSFLGIHEFGHYFAAVYHNIKTTLPYFIPLPVFIGTMGAVIRIKEPVEDSKKLFDIGIAGPLAGFVVSLIVLFYGFFTLPEPDYIMNFSGHEETKSYVQQYGTYPEKPISEGDNGNVQLIIMGNTLLYSILSSFFSNVPPMWEMYHYPFLFAGWLGLFFTALNLTPVGQLDGGHILYSLIGFKKHQFTARVFYLLLLILGGVGFLETIRPFINFESTMINTATPWIIWTILLFFLLHKAFRGNLSWIRAGGVLVLLSNALLMFYLQDSSRPSGFTMWLVWALFITFIVGIEHPPVRNEQKLDSTRRKLGWISMAIYVLCISPNPMYVLN